MTGIDIFVLIVLAIGLARGASRGLIRQICAVVGLVAGLLVARALYAVVGEELASQIGTSVTLTQIVSFVIIWAVIPGVLMLAGSVLTKTLDAISLGSINRLLGALAGVVLHLLVLGLLVRVVEYVDPENQLISLPTKQSSLFYYPLGELTGVFFPVVREIYERANGEVADALAPMLPDKFLTLCRNNLTN